LEDLLAFPLIRYSHTPLSMGVWRLRTRFSAYDAAYLALAEALDLPFLTCDARLTEAGPWVEAL
jgi:predicted nucleic acid-binding protein